MSLKFSLHNSPNYATNVRVCRLSASRDFTPPSRSLQLKCGRTIWRTCDQKDEIMYSLLEADRIVTNGSCLHLNYTTLYQKDKSCTEQCSGRRQCFVWIVIKTLSIPLQHKEPGSHLVTPLFPTLVLQLNGSKSTQECIPSLELLIIFVRYNFAPYQNVKKVDHLIAAKVHSHFCLSQTHSWICTAS